MNKGTYILIWYYHDCYVEYFDIFDEAIEYLENLKSTYSNDRDFSYKFFYGFEIIEKNGDMIEYE